jgi:putative membrane protein
MKKLLLPLTIIAAVICAVPAIAQDDKSAVSTEGAEFAKKAALGGLFEVELGKLAQQKAAASEVKSFGEMMVQDHGKANDKLKTLAAAKGIELPAALDEKHQKKVEKLSKLEGAEFDKEYAAVMTKAHEKDHSLFEKAAKDLEDADLKTFASETAPVIARHLEQIKGIKDSLK